ncbi:MAG: hypothetical protein H0U69_14165 [Trueperaceae bacterium]|nr:hypothetical protein [Trueperaceae bacterium]
MDEADDRLTNVFWLGGAPCAGKSSIGAILARRFDLDLYRVDDAFDRHVRSLDGGRQSPLVRWCAASCDERWMQPVDVLVRDAIACYREHLALVLADVRAWPTGRPLLVEGTALLPREVAEVVPDPSRALWVVATPAFVREHYPLRDWVWGVLATCTDSKRAFSNWMDRDVDFGAWVEAEVDHLGLRRLSVDGCHSVEEVADAVAMHVGLHRM